MKKIAYALFFLSLSGVGLISCTSTQVGTATGAAAGAGIGYAVGGGAAGTIIGAGAGALIGNQIGQEQDRRDWYWRHHHYH